MDFESTARWWVSNNKNENLNCVCYCALGSLETKEWFVLLGENLAWRGTSTRGSGKDAGQVEASVQGERAQRWTASLGLWRSLGQDCRELCG